MIQALIRRRANWEIGVLGAWVQTMITRTPDPMWPIRYFDRGAVGGQSQGESDHAKRMHNGPSKAPRHPFS
jgi:hypothetical protein